MTPPRFATPEDAVRYLEVLEADLGVWQSGGSGDPRTTFVAVKRAELKDRREKLAAAIAALKGKGR